MMGVFDPHSMTKYKTQCSTTLTGKAIRKKIAHLIYHVEVKYDFILQKALLRLYLKPPNKRKHWYWVKD